MNKFGLSLNSSCSYLNQQFNQPLQVAKAIKPGLKFPTRMHNPKESLSRRNFLKSSALTTAGLSMALPAIACITPSSDESAKVIESAVKSPAAKGAYPVSLFSKSLQWITVPEMAKEVASMGFDGVDLTIRSSGGHVEPKNAERDLPAAVKSIRNAGLNVDMVVTEIIDPKNALNELILKTLSNLGIKKYRTAFIPFDNSIGVEKSLEKFNIQFRELAALNKKYGMQGMYQNHSGVRLGGSVWDLWVAMKDADPAYIGIQYDPKHATIEGQASWVHSFDLVKNRIHAINTKDFYWEKSNNKWKQRQAPLGTGMVDFPAFFAKVKQNNIRVPISLHLEYPLGGAEDGNKTLTVSKEEVLNAHRRDIGVLRNMLKDAGLV